MKLMNFRRFDPDYPGKGLERGGKDEAVVWNLYFQSRTELRQVSDAIRSNISTDITATIPTTNSDEEVEAQEGHLLTRVHRYRERHPGIVKRKKESVLKVDGALVCS